MKELLQKLFLVAALSLVFAGPVVGKALADWSWGDVGGYRDSAAGLYGYFGW